MTVRELLKYLHSDETFVLLRWSKSKTTTDVKGHESEEVAYFKPTGEDKLLIFVRERDL